MPLIPQLNVVLVGPVPSGGLKAMRSSTKTSCTFSVHPRMREDRDLLKTLETADVVVGQYFTESMARAAHRLRLLHAVGAGVDSFCLPALDKRTTVANVYFHGAAVAEFVMMMMMAASRNLLEVDRSLRDGLWKGSWIFGDKPANEMVGKQLGIIGFGHIGRELARRAKAFRMIVWALSPSPQRAARMADRRLGSDALRELLQHSDYIVIACPLNASTQGLIGTQQFSWMKSSAVLVNIARAGIIDEASLYAALKSGRIAGAAVDVWYRHPNERRACRPAHYPFHKLRNIIMTPHIAGWTSGTFEQRFRAIAGNIDRLASGRKLTNVVQGATIPKCK